ncbi:GIN domain-containing protein [Hyphobacterium sp.]|uniref:GIN domain-containing protein n=1 Tax=Hyphobacterium sp. TaxID=2004662 RepID=UPI003B52D1F4
MKTPLAGSLAAIVGASLAIAQSDNREVRIRDYQRLEAGGNFNVVFEPNAEPLLRLEGDADDIDDIEIDMRDGELIIRQHRGFRRFFGGYRSLDVTVYLTAPDVTAFDLSRGVDAEMTGIDSSELSINVSTGAAATFAGSCGHATVNVSTGADLDGRNFDCASLRVNASTGSDAIVNARDSLVANVSTGADVRTLTNPRDLRMNTSTGGDVHIGPRS